MTIADTYLAALAADDAWQAELERRFGYRAGDVRYTPDARTGDLAPLYEAKRQADEAWQAAMDAQRTTTTDAPPAEARRGLWQRLQEGLR